MKNSALRRAFYIILSIILLLSLTTGNVLAADNQHEQEAIVETDGFSLYTVEFFYGELKYVLPGGTSVKASEILDALGLTGTASDVVCSKPELFSASDKTGEWVVTSHRAFDTEEWMSVTIDTVEYEIKVTDAQEVTSWDQLKEAINNASGTGPVEITLGDSFNNSSGPSPITIAEGKTITLDLNGHTITLADNTDGFEIKDGAKLTLTDSGTGGQINGGKTAVKILEYSIFEMENGTISNSETGVDVSESDEAGGIFKMDEGTISGNTTGVSLSTRGAFAMFGGSIINNITGVETSKEGVNFSIENKENTEPFTGKIIDNSDANVKLHKSGVIAIRCSIDEESKIGITILDNEGKPTYGSFTNKIIPPLTVPLTVFSSDDPKFVVSWDDFSRLQLVPKCIVTFDANGGSGEMGAQFIPPNTETELNANAFTKTGYAFVGWKDNKTGKTYKDQEAVKIAEDMTLSAQWNPIPYNIQFVGDNGETLYQSTFNYDSKPEYKGETPTKPDDEDYTYTWNGWMDTASKEQYAKDQLPTVKGNTTYKAIFTAKKKNTYTVAFNTNGHGTAPAAQTVPENDRAKKPSSPTAQGYEFSGWYTEASCVNAYDFSTPVTGDITLYAKWTRNSSGGGSGGSGGGKVPNTFDSNRSMLWIILTAASLLAICGCIGIFRRHRSHH